MQRVLRENVGQNVLPDGHQSYDHDRKDDPNNLQRMAQAS